MRSPVHNARTLTALLEARVAATPGGECLRFESHRLTFADVSQRANRLATMLSRLGIRAGQRVAVVVPNGLDFPIAWLALARLRATVVPVQPASRGYDLRHVLRRGDAQHALVGPAQEEAVLELREQLPVLRSVSVLDGEGRLGAPPTVAESERSLGVGPSEPNDAVTIQFTSGTTGMPKGCVLDHTYWLTLAHAAQSQLHLDSSDTLLTAQPQSYMDPSWNLVLAILVGAPLVVLPRFSASRFWEDVRANGATFFYCIGTMPLYLMKQPPDKVADRDHKVRFVYCSGIPPTLHASIEERWGCPWRETYGSTELGMVLTVPPDDASSVGTGNMGTAVPGRSVRVVGEDGRDLADGVPGELWVRGPGGMQGYYREPEPTAKRMVDGWARTGDIVTRLANGGYRLIGRKRDIIRRGGQNVSAAEVESVLVEHPDVRAAACIAVPDPEREEEVKAYIQLVESPEDPPPHPAAIRAFVAQRLARFKAPRYIEFVDTFPLTESQKIAKAVLAESRADHVTGAWDAESAVT